MNEKSGASDQNESKEDNMIALGTKEEQLFRKVG